MSIVKLLRLIQEDSPNIAERLSSKKLEKIGQDCVHNFKRDDNSRSEWVERHKKIVKLAMQIIEPKNYPWPHASNVKYPLLTTASIAFASRVYPEILPDDSVVKCKTFGADPDYQKYYRADRVAKHMSYQLLVQNPAWSPDTDKLLHMLPIMGTVFRKVYWDFFNDIPKSDLCNPLDIIVNNGANSVETAVRITHRYYVSKNYIIERIRSGLFLDINLDEFEEALNDRPAWGYEDQEITPEEDKPNQGVELIEQHCFLDLDGDGYAEPYTIIAHTKSEQVLAIYARFDPVLDIELNDDDEIKKIKAFQHFVGYHFIPSADGSFYSTGFGHLLYPINETINSVINNLIDSGTLSNLQGGFISRMFKIKGGTVKPAMGEFQVVDIAPGMSLGDQILPFAFKEPSQVLFSLLQFLVDAAQQMASINDVMTGQALPQNSPTGSTMEIASQGLKVFNCISKRAYKSFQAEFDILFKLNSRYLPEEEYFVFHDDEQAIAKQDYEASGIDVYPVSDPSISSDSKKMATANLLLTLAQTPWAQAMAPQEAVALILRAVDVENEDIGKLMPPPDPNAPPPIEQQELELKAQQLQATTDIENKKAQVKMYDVQSKRMQVEMKMKESQSKILKMRADAMKDFAVAEQSKEQLELQKKKLELDEVKLVVDKANADANLHAIHKKIDSQERVSKEKISADKNRSKSVD